jgi:hypothetical protein
MPISCRNICSEYCAYSCRACTRRRHAASQISTELPLPLKCRLSGWVGDERVCERQLKACRNVLRCHPPPRPLILSQGRDANEIAPWLGTVAFNNHLICGTGRCNIDLLTMRLPNNKSDTTISGDTAYLLQLRELSDRVLSNSQMAP